MVEVAATNADVPGMPWTGIARREALGRVLAIEQARSTARWLCIVERRSGRIVGMASLQVPNPSDGVPWIGLLVLHRDAQGRGLGTETVRAIEARLRRLGWFDIRLCVHRANAGALRFWARLGYRPARDAWRAYDISPASMTILSKAIAAGRGRRIAEPVVRRSPTPLPPTHPHPGATCVPLHG